jgi:hypothetical protein
MNRNVELIAVPVITQVLLKVLHVIEEHKFFAFEIPFELPQIIVNCYNDAIASIYKLIEAISYCRLILIPSCYRI